MWMLCLFCLSALEAAAFSPSLSSGDILQFGDLSQGNGWSRQDEASLQRQTTLLSLSTTAEQASEQQTATVSLQKEEPSTVPAPETQAAANNNVDPQLSLLEAKSELLDLLPRMTGLAEEFRRVETLINTLEDLYQPIETLDFLNLLQQGDWQLLFSTNLASKSSKTLPSPQVFRLREMRQTLQCANYTGQQSTTVRWDLAQAIPGQFDVSGTFTIKCSYDVTPPAKLQLNMDQGDPVLQLAKGSQVPQDVEALVGLLHRAMPAELFEPADHAMDTTYLDHDLRLVRYTGTKYEGVRDIWIRHGALSVDPTGGNSAKEQPMSVTDQDESYDSMMMSDDEDTSMFMDEE